MMDEAWRPPGFCVPHPTTYPFQWLWDSCFHGLVWMALGDERAVTEIETALVNQHPSGFVPHLTYWAAPDHHRSFWGRSTTSTITQPPMFGHAVAELVRSGVDVSDRLVDAARRGVRAAATVRSPSPAGLPVVVHPWETGCDDSMRWDHWRRADPSIAAWKANKGVMVEGLELDADGAAVGSRHFVVGSVGFAALVAWNAAELRSIGADPGVDLAGLTDAIAGRWSAERRTWIDDGPNELTSGGLRTADALLCLLVDPRPEAFAQLADHAAFLGPFGVRGAHPSEPAYEPLVYWRGGSWPQLNYLLAVAAAADGRRDLASVIADRLALGATRSRLAEYWHPENGRGLGAVPQTWAGLTIPASRFSARQ